MYIGGYLMYNTEAVSSVYQVIGYRVGVVGMLGHITLCPKHPGVGCDISTPEGTPVDVFSHLPEEMCHQTKVNTLFLRVKKRATLFYQSHVNGSHKYPNCHSSTL